MSYFFWIILSLPLPPFLAMEIRSINPIETQEVCNASMDAAVEKVQGAGWTVHTKGCIGVYKNVK